jgi:two-component system, OmpR family, response regulator
MTKDSDLFLIVDDEPDMCWVLEHVLTQGSHLVMKALSGREAIELMKTHKFRMAFVDLKLDDIEGLELARRLKSADPSLRIAMVSGFCYKDDSTIQKALAEGLICDFIAKPFLHSDIIRSLELAYSAPDKDAQVTT